MCALVTGVQTCALPISFDLAKCAVRQIGVVRREVRQCVVAPVIGKALFDQMTVAHECVYRQQLDGGDAETLQIFNVLGMAECRSEEHTSELQSLMRSSNAVFRLKKKNRARII